jgi:nucleoside-diphosphate-sugar epimerase
MWGERARVFLVSHEDVDAGRWPRVSIIIHAGAKVFADQSFADPYPYVESNVVGTVRALEHAKTIYRRMKETNNCDRNNRLLFVYLSTHEVGANASPYAATKLAGENMVVGYHNAYGIPYLIVRLPNLFLPAWDEKGFVGKLLRCEISGPRDPARSRQWLNADMFALRLWQTLLLHRNETLTLDGVWYTDQEIADLTEGYRQGIKE